MRTEPAPEVRRARIMMVAGEASGDFLGAEVAARLRARMPDCEISGLAGARMREAGVRPLVKVEAVAGMGAAELAGTIAATLRAFRVLRLELRREKPDLLILIDFADFNLKFAWFAKRAGVRVLYYVPPQVWAWRKWRIKTLIRRTDRIGVVFPFEAELYQKRGGRADFVGHPLLDRVKPAQDRVATLARHNLPPRSRLLAILPGSRCSEIRYLLKPMIAAARVLCADHDLMPVIALASTLKRSDLVKAAGDDGLDGMHIVEDDTYSIIAASELALVASGTATLETALLGCPMVIAYKMSPSSYVIGKLLIRGVDFIGMPNLLAGRRIVPELIQNEVTPENLIRAAEPMLAPSLRAAVAAELLALRGKLGESGAADRIAAIALAMIG